MSIIISNVNTNTLNIYNNTSASSKVCSQCHQNKLLTENNKDKRKLDGLRCNCKSWQVNTNKHYQENNKKIRATKSSNKNDVKICSKCSQSKLITEYNKDRINSSGLH